MVIPGRCEMYRRLLRRMIDAGSILAEKGLVAEEEGNLSIRTDDGKILITRSGARLGRLDDTDFLKVDLSGKVLTGSGKLTSEKGVHQACYRQRPDIGAVIHAHPPNVISLTLAGIPMTAVPIPEVAYTVGSVPTTDFAVPGTDEGGRVIEEMILTCDAVLLKNHGAVTVGKSVEEALGRILTLEKAALIIIRSIQLGV